MPIPARPCPSRTRCPARSTRPQCQLGCWEHRHAGKEHGYQTSPRGTARRGTGLPPCAGHGPGDEVGRRFQSRFKKPESHFPLEHPSGFLLQHQNYLGSQPCRAGWVPRLAGGLEASPKIDELKQSSVSEPSLPHCVEPQRGRPAPPPPPASLTPEGSRGSLKIPGRWDLYPGPIPKANPDDPWGRALPFVAALGALPRLRSSLLPSKSLPRSQRFQAASGFQNTRNSPQKRRALDPPGNARTPTLALPAPRQPA